MIVVTGSEGFIGKNLMIKLKNLNHEVIGLDIKNISLFDIIKFLNENYKKIDLIFHFGAISDTTIDNDNLLYQYNYEFSVYIFNLCVTNNITLIYASSASTYGNGEFGFEESNILKLKPLNKYGYYKHIFDLYAYNINYDIKWYGLKLFNVYGFDEKHKGNMASMVYKLFKEIIVKGSASLFKSHDLNYKNGEQKRDFIYIDDVVDICIKFMKIKPESGIYNVGTGIARSFNDIANIIFEYLNFEKKFDYYDIPYNIRNNYQYYTKADINKLINSGCNVNFNSLEEGILKYINILKNENW